MDENIPKFLAVSGVINTCFFAVIVLVVRNKETWKATLGTLISVLCTFAALAIQIWGSVIVFSKWNDLNNGRSKDGQINGCDTTAYLFSFSILIIFWILGPCFCCFGIGIMFGFSSSD